MLPMFWGFVAALCFVSVPLIVAQFHAPARFKPLTWLHPITQRIPVARKGLIVSSALIGLLLSIVGGWKLSQDGAQDREPISESAEEQEARRNAAKERIAARKSEAEEEARRIDEERKKLATAAANRAREADRVTREIRARVLASAFTYDMTVVANREDGLVVREASAEGKLFFVPHVTATRRLPLGREFSAKGWRRGLTYRLNDTTVLEVITLAE